MKPLHIGLLITGAVLAGGLALTLSKPPAFPVAATPPASRVRVSPPAPTPAPAYAHAPAPVAQHAPAKPKPFPPAVTSPAPEFVSPEPVAPQPVYVEPVAPAVRKNKPISVQAKLTPPPPYLPPSRSVPVSAPPQSAAPASDPPSTSVPAAVAPSDTASITKGDEQKLPEPAPPPVPDPAPARHVTLRVGMTFKVRLDQGLSSERDFAGDTFRASLAEPLVVDGLVIAERGARVTGRIVESRRAGRLNGTSAIRLALTTLYTSDGQKVTISTDPWSKQGDSSAGRDAAKIGGGAALGAIIGALAGGGTGAVIGAGLGGGAGMGMVAATRGKPASVPGETIIPFRLASGMTITEQR